MTNILLGISFIALVGYGYWLMTRLEHYEKKSKQRHAVYMFSKE